MGKWMKRIGAGLLALSVFLSFGFGRGKLKKQITFMLWGSPKEVSLMRKWVKKFEKENSGIKVKINHVAVQGYEEKFLVFTVGGVPSDVAWINLRTFGVAVRKGILSPLDSFVKKDNYPLKSFYPVLIKAFSYQGNLYALPLICNVDVLFYNKDLFDKAGVPYPDGNWDWEKFKEAVKRLTIVSSEGKPVQYGIYYNGDWIELIWQNEGQVLDERGEKFLFTSPEFIKANIEAIKFFLNLGMRYSPMQSREESALQFFSSGKVAMMVGGSWSLFLLDKYAPNIRWGIAPLPKGKRRATKLHSVGLVIPKGSHHLEEAWELIKFLSQEEVERDLASAGRSIPCQVKVAREIYPNSEIAQRRGLDLKPVLDSLNYARVAEKGALYREIMEQLVQPEFEKVELRKETVKEAFQNIDLRAGNILKK